MVALITYADVSDILAWLTLETAWNIQILERNYLYSLTPNLSHFRDYAIALDDYVNFPIRGHTAHPSSEKKQSDGVLDLCTRWCRFGSCFCRTHRQLQKHCCAILMQLGYLHGAVRLLL
jgi:hypothetical protein